jgi:hypothetical protein
VGQEEEAWVSVWVEVEADWGLGGVEVSEEIVQAGCRMRVIPRIQTRKVTLESIQTRCKVLQNRLLQLRSRASGGEGVDIGAADRDW